MNISIAMARRLTAATLPALVLTAGLAGQAERAYAAPPPWAPAHGYRAKQGRHERPAQAEVHYGIERGRCDYEALAGILGGAAGAAVGSQIGDGSGRTAAIVAGTVIGYILGTEVGHYLDRVDERCIGHALEYASDHQTVDWINPRSGHRYELTPQNTYRQAGRACRDYSALATIDGRIQQHFGSACRGPDGLWESTR